MPSWGKSKRKRTYAKRRSIKRRTAAKRSRPSYRRHVPRPLYPKSFTGNFKWATSTNMAPGTAKNTFDTFIIRASSLYDPTYSPVVGRPDHQPMGFDQVMPRYGHFRVNYATVVVKFSSMPHENVLADYPIRTMIALRSDYNNLVAPGNDKSWECIKEGGNCVFGQMTPYQITNTLKFTYNARQFFGAKFKSKDVLGDINNNPTDNAYFHIGTCTKDTDVMGHTPTCNYDICVYFNATFMERQPIAQS